jgi:ketosteroid isomerase-like protein
MSESDAVRIAKMSYQAYVDKDRETIESLLAEDFHFTSPLDNRINRKTYFARCWPNSEQLTDFAFIRAVAAGDAVFVTYEATTMSGKRFRNTEVMTIRNGKIHAVEVYFGWDLPHPARAGSFTKSSSD